MVLSELKQYLKERHLTTLSQLMQHFETDSDLMHDMLAHYIEAGQLHMLTCDNSANHTCGGCQMCDKSLLETYEWLGEKS